MADQLDDAIEAAQAYESLHVKALFGQWAQPMLDAGGITAGNKVLDVACGTGVLARAALDRVGPTGSVTGLDIDPGMLAVAEEIAPRATWTIGQAGDLPFDDNQFDVVMSQFGLMFFPDRVQAIGEMLRCAKPGGRIAVAVWDSLERSEAYPISVRLLHRLAGPDAADALRAPFVLGDIEQVRQILEDAGALEVAAKTHQGTARFPSVRAMVEADLRGWLPIMGVVLDDDLIDQILAEAEVVHEKYVAASGEMVFDAPAHIVTGVAP